MKVHRYNLPFTQPLVLPQATLTSRQGLLVRMASDSAHGWGEAAPLVGFSVETLDEAARELLAIRNSLIGKSIGKEFLALTGRFEEMLSEYDLSPSSCCAVEMAMVNLLRVSESAKPTSVAVNGLLPRSSDDVASAVEDFLRHGYTSIKLKVGQEPVAKEIARVISLASLIAQRGTLRIDVNRTWSFDEACLFLKETDLAPLEYVEEPVASYPELFDLLGEPGLAKRIALDESLSFMTPEDLRSFPPIAAVVLKPTMLGGLERAASFARIATERGTRVVISSSFETAVGLECLAWLSGTIGSDTPHGLDTARFFDQAIVKYRPSVQDGKMTFGDSPFHDSDFDRSLLSELTND